MSDKLLPCPFCGGPAGFEPNGRSPGYWVRCRDCYTSTGDHIDHDAAAKAWNTRSNPSHAQLAAARSALAGARKALVDTGYCAADAEVVAIDAALSTLAQEAAGQSEEPAAWQYRCIGKDGTVWIGWRLYTKERHPGDEAWDGYYSYEFRGLYPVAAHPTVKVSGDAAEMRERLGRVLREMKSAHTNQLNMVVWEEDIATVEAAITAITPEGLS